MKNKTPKIILGIGVAWLLLVFGFCGKQKDVVTIPGRPAEPISVTCNGTPVGNRRNLVCEQGWRGSIEQECSAEGTWKLIASTCAPIPTDCENQAGFKTTFDQNIKPILDKSCISCHKAIELNTYDAAKKYIDEMVRRINLDDLNRERMPQSPNLPLTFEERDLFVKWKNDGLIENTQCEDPGDRVNVDFNTFDSLETSIQNDLDRLDGRAKLNARYLTADNKHNLGALPAEKKIFQAGILKAINAVNTLTSDLTPCVPIDKISGACRVDLESFGLTAADWDLVVQHAKLVFESATSKGKVIAQQTGAKIPWLTGDQFIESALGVPDVYYTLTKIPTQQADYLRAKGIVFDKDFADFRTTCGGGLGSPIAENKTRLICFFKGIDGDCATTFDTVALGGVKERDLFEFPLVFVGLNRFNFNASEIICRLPNGSLEMSLWNNLGVRQNAAPTNIVADVEDPFGDFEIRVGKKCQRCHSAGWIVFKDQVRDSVAANPNIGAGDKELVKALYGTQGQLEATFGTFNRHYAKSMLDIGTDTSKADPITYYTDRYLKNWTLADVCAFVRIPIKDCELRIRGSGVLAAKFNQLLNGDTISLDQFSDNFPAVIVELQLGQDPIEEQ